MLQFGQFCDAYFPVLDGVIMVVKHYAQILNDQYGKCVVVAPAVPKYEEKDDFEVIRVKSVPIPQRHPYRYALPRLDRHSADKIKACPLDLIHTHSPFGISQYGLKVAQQRNIPIISTFHSKYCDDFKQVLKTDQFLPMLQNHIVKYYNQVDQVWTVNHSTATTLREYGYQGNIEVILNGSDVRYPENGAQLRTAVREKYQLPDDRPIFLFVGQHIWQKNIKHLIESIAWLKQNGFSCTVLMVGKGCNFDDIQQMVKEKGLEKEFVFMGAVYDREELSSLYLAADLFLFPSVYDNAPLVVKEAASLRVPSLVVEGANAAEGITDCQNGFLTQDDPEVIGKKIKEIFETKQDLTAIGKRAEETLPVSWESIVADVYGRYEELIQYKKQK